MSTPLINFVKNRQIVPALLITEMSQQTARQRRLEMPQNPTRGYLDPATVEQHQMIGQVRGYNQSFKHPPQKQMGVLYMLFILVTTTKMIYLVRMGCLTGLFHLFSVTNQVQISDRTQNTKDRLHMLTETVSVIFSFLYIIIMSF